jgi:hypothetical protein
VCLYLYPAGELSVYFIPFLFFFTPPASCTPTMPDPWTVAQRQASTFVTASLGPCCGPGQDNMVSEQTKMDYERHHNLPGESQFCSITFITAMPIGRQIGCGAGPHEADHHSF